MWGKNDKAGMQDDTQWISRFDAALASWHEWPS